MGADSSSLQGLAEGFAALDPQGTGKIPYQAVREMLASGKYDLSDVEVSTRELQTATRKLAQH